MIRKTIIVVLALGAVGTGVLWAGSYLSPLTWAGVEVDTVPSKCIRRANDAFPTSKLSGGALEVEFVREMPSRLPPSAWPRVDSNLVILRFETTGERSFMPPDGPVSHAFRIDTLHVPLLGPFVVLLAYPALAFIRGPLRRFRRRRKGLCVRCAYNLTGNVSGTCPECGSQVRRRGQLTQSGRATRGW
jgi:hypothetical protein